MKRTLAPPPPRPVFEPQIRIAVLGGYEQLARRLGLDPVVQLNAVAIAPAWVADPERKVPVAALARLLENSAAASGCEYFGLRLSENIHLARLGLLALAVYEEPTVARAAAAVTRMTHLHNEALDLWIEASGDDRVIHEEYLSRTGTAMRQLVEMTMGVVYRNMRVVIGENWVARTVCFRHPPPHRPAAYRAVFGTRVYFDCDFDGMICSAADFAAPNRLSDRVAADYIRSYLDGDDLRPYDTARDRALRLIWGLLPGGRCSADRVAGHLNMDRRTLHRHLAKQKTSYSDLVDAARRELATRYVAQGSKSLTEVADLLGFVSLSDFSHWFARRFDGSPSAWRRRQYGGAPGAA